MQGLGFFVTRVKREPAVIFWGRCLSLVELGSEANSYTNGGWEVPDWKEAQEGLPSHGHMRLLDEKTLHVYRFDTLIFNLRADGWKRDWSLHSRNAMEWSLESSSCYTAS